ncbi:hypothetical protein BRE01_50240 [Brevibacillus reuszeri]|uniref:Uncharacterized protein n=1 Tax=Brevibacillus reuszeri TaxID=54915 RepID=A0ABQ0TVC6_9BACL|nr:hypothetical protein BRE01_50240 [Brevibacillus reuszeri]
MQKTAEKAIPNTFSHPDFTVGLGFSPSQSLSIQLIASRGLRRAFVITAGRELHPTLKAGIQLGKV